MPLNSMAGKGPLRHSEKVRTAHDSVASNDVDNFDRGGQPGERHVDMPAPNPVKVIASFANLGEALRRSGTFREVAEQISRISEMAEQTIMQEAGDWFDAQTIKRNIKEMSSYAKDFGKIAEEMDAMQQRATALYDDMGNVLARYFEMSGDTEEAPEEAPYGGEKAPEFDGPGGNPTDDAGRKAWDKRDGVIGDEAPFGGKKAPPFTPGDPTAAAGRKKWDMRDGEADDEVEESVGGKNESAVAPDAYNARRALKLPRSQQRVQGGFTRDQAKDILKKGKASTVSEAKKYLYTVKEIALRKIVKSKTPGKINEQKVDVFTAGTIVAVLDGLKTPKNKEKFLSMPISKMAQTAFKMVK